MRVRMAISSVRVTWLLRTSNSPPKLGMFCGIGMPFLEVVRLSLIRPPSATVCHGDRGVECRSDMVGESNEEVVVEEMLLTSSPTSRDTIPLAFTRGRSSRV